MEKKNKIPEDLQPTSFRLPPSLKKEMKQATVDYDVDQAKMVIEGVRMWLEAKRNPGRSGITIVAEPVSEGRWHRLLTQILESGDSEIISAIQQNLKAFSRVSELPAADHTKKRRSGGD